MLACLDMSSHLRARHCAGQQGLLYRPLLNIDTPRHTSREAGCVLGLRLNSRVFMSTVKQRTYTLHCAKAVTRGEPRR